MSKGKLLIVEESLLNLDGHFYDYIFTIAEEAKRKDWQVEVAAHINVIDDIKKTVEAFPVFANARFADQSKRRKGDRYFSLLTHNWSTLRNLWSFLKSHPSDLALVPTTLAHHLLAWWWVMKFHPNRPRKLVLLFLNTPAIWNAEKKTSVLTKSSSIVALLVRLFRKMHAKGDVILSTQTKSAKREMEELSHLPFELFPQPVNCIELKLPSENNETTFGFFGFTRHEKGSDIFINALKKILKENPNGKARFIIQWTSSFILPDGSVFDLDDDVRHDPRVRVITHLLTPEEYYQLLSTTDCLVLPYRNSSYYSRDSRITIEAVTSGRPVIYTRGGWLDETVNEFGAGIGIEDENTDQLTEAIMQMMDQIDAFKLKALEKKEIASLYYAPQFFVEKLLDAQR